MDSLFIQAALGMYQILEANDDKSSPMEYEFHIDAGSYEELLVKFLSELLFLIENKKSIFSAFTLSMTAHELTVKMKGKSGVVFSSEIKAVTYHNLEIRKNEQSLEAIITFDV